MRTTLDTLGKFIIHFDYGQPWIYYYITSTIHQLGTQFAQETLDKITKALKYCWN